MNEKVTPGIHQDAQAAMANCFSEEEKTIAKYWGREWYITNANKIDLGASSYNYFLVRASDKNEKALGLSREVIVVLSNYSKFEPRTLDAFDRIYKTFSNNRIERICYVLISGDMEIETRLRDTLSSSESQVIIPFSYRSFEEHRGDDYFLSNQFKKYFYSCDLFDFSEPLKKDFFFFGRDLITTNVIKKHCDGQNFGLFGLRKTGKTSIIYDVLRRLPNEKHIGVLIDCQAPSFNHRRWNQALYYVSERVCNEAEVICTIPETQFTEIEADRLFQKEMALVSKKTSKRILLMFDEIENITFGKAHVNHWCNNLDFIYFWQSIRSAFQQPGSKFSFCILGTNPKCVEDATIGGKDNPIFNAFQPKYIPGFDAQGTREMVRKLGRIMGIKFDETIYGKLTEDYGGHPFLIRQMCSAIAQKYPDRPITIDRVKYQDVKRQFNQEDRYFPMLLQVLKEFYPDEYEMLNLLAIEDDETFKFYAQEDHSMIDHLIGYGIIRELDGTYDFQIDALKEYILRKNKSKKIFHTVEEKWMLLCTQRNQVEIDLRRMVRIILRTAHKNEGEVKDYVLKKLYGKKERELKKYGVLTYKELFDSRKGLIFLKNLKDLIASDWEYFSDYWHSQEEFNANMGILNKEGRFDAHATNPTEEEMKMVKIAIYFVQSGINKWNETMG